MGGNAESENRPLTVKIAIRRSPVGIFPEKIAIRSQPRAIFPEKIAIRNSPRAIFPKKIAIRGSRLAIFSTAKRAGDSEQGTEFRISLRGRTMLRHRAKERAESENRPLVFPSSPPSLASPPMT